MLARALNRERAVLGNIELMRACGQRRRLLAAPADLARRLAALEKTYDAECTVVVEAIRQLMAPPETTRRSMGFRVEEGDRCEAGVTEERIGDPAVCAVSR